MVLVDNIKEEEIVIPGVAGEVLEMQPTGKILVTGVIMHIPILGQKKW